MTIHEIDAIGPIHEGKSNYVIAEARNKIGEKKLIFRADPAKKHFEILHDLRMEADKLKVECFGGGSISVKNERKEICLYGWADDFDMEPSRERTAEMLREKFKGFTIYNYTNSPA